MFSVIVKDNASPKTSPKTTAKILDAIITNSSISIKELSEFVGISAKGVKWQIAKLKKEGVIRREGSSRNGKWVVVEE